MSCAGVVASALALLVAAGCASSSSTTPNDTVDAAIEPPPSLGGDGGAPVDPLASDAGLALRASQVFTGCQGGVESACHGLGQAGTHLKLGPDGDLVNVASTERPDLKRVLPGDPANSYLYLKVLGDGGIEGGRMPLGGSYDPRLPPFIASWIQAGAPSP